MTVTNGYASLADVKAALRITDTVDDTLIEIGIESASREIDGYCERVFYNFGTATRLFLPTDNFLVQIDDLQSISALKTDSNGDRTFDVTWSADDYQLEPLNGFVSGLEQPYTRIRAVGSYLFPVFDVLNSNYYEASIQITGDWGFASVPTVTSDQCVSRGLTPTSSRCFRPGADCRWHEHPVHSFWYCYKPGNH